MVATPGQSATYSNTTGTEGTPTVPIPTGGATGDVVLTWFTYGGTEGITAQPSGWTVHATGNMNNSGAFALVSRPWQSGMAAPTWTLGPAAAAWGKIDGVSVIVKGGGTITLGTVLNRVASSAASVLPAVTAVTDGLLVAFGGDRVSNQTTVTAPTGMTEWAKNITGGGGGVSAIAAWQSGVTAGSSGTRTINYGVGSSNGAGILVMVAPAATGSAPTLNAGADARIPKSSTLYKFGGSQSGATSVTYTQIAGPPVTISAPTDAVNAGFTPSVSGVYTFRLSGSNASGAGTPDDVTITVTDTAAGVSQVTVNPGNFVPVPTTSTLEAVLSDGSGSTYAESTDVGASMTTKLSPLTSGPGYTFTISAKYSTTPVAPLLIELLQGSTVIATRTWATTATGGQPALGVGTATYTLTTTSGETAAVSDPADLSIRLTRQ
jgi:hypothetical protein